MYIIIYSLRRAGRATNNTLSGVLPFIFVIIGDHCLFVDLAYCTDPMGLLSTAESLLYSDRA